MQSRKSISQTLLIKLIISCVFIFNFSQPSFGDDSPISTSEAVDQIQKTLLFSNKEEAEKISSQRKAISIDRSTKDKTSSIEILVTDPKNNTAIEQKQKLAYNSASAGQYEVAVELYKQILKSDPKNSYAKFALASSYHMLGQYKQAKTIYYQLLKNDWDEKTKNELIGNLISVIVEESPNDAVYVLEKLSNENPSSAYIMAGAAMAYDKIKQTDQAILLLKRAINIDPSQVKYKFNLAIIYDKTEDYQNALKYYQDVVKNYVSSEDIDNSVPIVQVRQRIEFVKNKI
jgi:tetratricopeptide (TPR) repeat protein